MAETDEVLKKWKNKPLEHFILIAIKSEFNFRINGQYSNPLIVIIPTGKIVFFTWSIKVNKVRRYISAHL